MKLGLTLALLIGGTATTKMSILATATNTTTTMLSRILGAFHGALVSDALCLGSHYEYDAPTIKSAYGGKRIERYMSPGELLGGSTHGVGWGRRNYHPGQKAGDRPIMESIISSGWNIYLCIVRIRQVQQLIYKTFYHTGLIDLRVTGVHGYVPRQN